MEATATAASRVRRRRIPRGMTILLLLILASSVIQIVGAESNGKAAKSTPAKASSWDVATAKIKSTARKSLSKVSRGLEWLGYVSGFGEQCSFVDHPSAAVRKHLQKHLKAQDHALDTVVAAVEAWEFSRSNAKDHAPLVLAITGPTGTGKTETSNLLAEALFKWRKRLDHSDKESPSGLLVFRGEDFSDNYTNPVTQYQEQIKSRLAEHLYRCSGKALVVFDEVQKVIPHTLDVLTSAMSSNAHLTYYRNGVERRIDTANVIFVLISDIGVAKMEQLLIQYKDRRDVPVTQLENDVKRALDAQWARLQFGKMVRQVVPFLPFEPHHIVQVIQAKLDQLSRHYEGVYWKSLAFDAALAAHLSTLESMLYIERRAVVRDVEVRKVFAKYGARNVETGPMQQLKAKLMRYARPWNPEAEFTVRLLDDGHTIDIVSCVEERANAPLADTTSNAGGDTAPPSDAITIACVSRWKGAFT